MIAMGYDIPDRIRYKEKIVLNLDIKQLGYFTLSIAAAIFLLNLPIEGEPKFILPSISVLIGAGMAFLNLEERLLDMYSYYRGIRKAVPEDQEAQDFMGVMSIANNTIHLKNRELLAVLQVYPVNFELLDDERKKSLIANYRAFLNHISTPIQILIRTTDASLENYFEAQEMKFSESAKEFSALYTDFRIFESDFLTKNKVKERHYYLIIRHMPRKRITKTVANKILPSDDEEIPLLEQHVQIITEKLGSCGLFSKRLDNAELIDLLLAHSDEEGEEPPKPPAPKKHLIKLPNIFGKKKRELNFFRFMLTPSFEIAPDYAKLNETYHRIVKVDGYPRNVEDGWLRSFLGKNEGYDVSIHIHPSTIAYTLVALHNQIIRQSADLMMSTAKGTPNPALEIKRTDTMRTYGQLYKGEEKLFRVSIYLDNKETSLDRLNLLSEKCNANLNALLMVPKTATYRMADGIKSTLPLAQDKLELQRDFLTSPLCATFPFISPASTKRDGIMFAHEEETLNPLFVDFNNMSNKHFFVLGISGSGKSYTAKYLTIQHLMNDDARVFIIDPNAEYRGLTKNLGGEVVELSKDSNSIINVFDMGNEDFGSKMLSLISVFDIISGGLTESQKGVLNEALLEVYRRKNIHFDKKATWKNTPPTFSDFKVALETILKKSERRKYSSDDRSAETLINRVRMYTKSGFFGFLDEQTKIDLKGDFLDFDLSRLPAPVKKLMMFVVLDLISREMKKDTKPKVVLIDEGWSLLRSKEAEGYMLDFIKTSRKYNTSIGFITQEIEDLLRSEGGKSILNLTSTKILLRQNPSNLDLVSQGLKLNDSERDFLLRANRGHGILITEEGHYRFFAVAPPRIHALITTDPNEEKKVIEKMEVEIAKKGIKLNLSRGFYARMDLSESQQKELRQAGYVLHKDKIKAHEGSAYYFVKTQGNESPRHALFCWLIADLLRSRKLKPKVNASSEADVVVKIGKARIAFEVETGENMAADAEGLKQRLEDKQREFDDFVILVTDRLLRDKYAKIARTIPRAELDEVISELADKYSQKAKRLKSRELAAKTRV